MKKVVPILLFLMAARCAMAQSSGKIMKKYLNDTTGFTPYPDTLLIKNLHLPEKYKTIEINTWVGLYVDRKPKYQYRNVYRYPPTAFQKLPDTTVASKCDFLQCFAVVAAPDIIPWYMSAQTENNKTITIGKDTLALKTFLGNTADQFNAYFWLQAYNMCHLFLYEVPSDIPVSVTRNIQYKKVHNGFLIRYRACVSDCPITSAQLTYFVSDDFRVILISKRKIAVYKGCA